MDWCRKWFGRFDRAFDFLNDLWCLFRFAHPVKRLNFSVFVDFKRHNTNGVKKWGQFSLVDAVLVKPVNVFGRILSVFLGRARK